MARHINMAHSYLYLPTGGFGDGQWRYGRSAQASSSLFREKRHVKARRAFAGAQRALNSAQRKCRERFWATSTLSFRWRQYVCQLMVSAAKRASAVCAIPAIEMSAIAKSRYQCQYRAYRR
jgi:hypothetical protein